MSRSNGTVISISGRYVYRVLTMIFSVKIATLLLLLLSICILTPSLVQAEGANLQEMERVCQNWLTYIVSEKSAWAGETNPQIVDVQEIVENDTLLARCFSIHPHGYVVVPVLKELPPITACSEESNLDVNRTGGFTQLLRDVLLHRIRLYVNNYGSLDAVQPSTGNILFDKVNRQQWDRYSIDPDEFEASLGRGAFAPMTQAGPLLTTSWDQSAPYNNFCPIGYEGYRCVVGCVATAAAQIMAYHQWPLCGYGSSSYYWGGDNSCSGNWGGGLLSADYSDSYDWANMPDDCPPYCSQDEKNALAELCYEVGVAFNMDYGVCGSGAYTADALNVFPGHFRYSSLIDKEDRSAHSAGSWFNLIQTETNAGRPMQYRIHRHSIVCDGWRDTGGMNQYHMNYGWDDGHNTWYTIDNLHCDWEGCDPMVEYMIRHIIPDRGVMFTADTTFGWVPFDVSFTGTSEYSVDSWMWNFGDGYFDTTYTETLTHTYETPGMFDVSLVVDTGGDTLSIQRHEYIIALADSLIATDVMGSKYSVVEMTVYARNNVPINKLIIPFEFFGTLNTSYEGDTFSTVGCRTETFEIQSWLNYNLSNGQGTVKLETTSSELPPGEGAVLKLYFRIPYYATSEQVDTVELDGYGTYSPEFSGYVAEYQPRPIAGTITATCCTGIRGNVDGDLYDNIDVVDITYLVGYLFTDGSAPPCIDEGNVDGIEGVGGPIDVSDLTYLVEYLFLEGAEPPPCL